MIEYNLASTKYAAKLTKVGVETKTVVYKGL